MKKKKILGIIGGMGPEATAYLFEQIIRLTPVTKDQDHLEIYIHNNTNIPDRTKAIIKEGDSPLPELIRSAKVLEKMGADYIVIPCFTAHYFVPDLQKNINVPILNAIQICIDEILFKYPNIKQVGLLATTGTIKSKLFQSVFEMNGLETKIPSEELQTNMVMDGIYGEEGIKNKGANDYSKNKLKKAGEYLIENGAEALVAGCSEIPLAVNQKDFIVPYINPIEFLALKAITKCYEGLS